MRPELRPNDEGILILSCLLGLALMVLPAKGASPYGSGFSSPGLNADKGESVLQIHPSQDRIALYKKFLLGPDPKPEKSEERRIAILSLVRNPDPRAHAVLQEVLALAGNPVRVPLSTLEKICEALTEQEILDLGGQPFAKTDPASSKKLEIYRSYVPVMIALRAKKVGAKPSVLSSIRRFFLLLPAKVRREVLARELTNKDHKLVAAAVRISGITRDPELAPFLAPLLGQKDLKPIVQDALARLTLRVALFHTDKEFFSWWKSHKGKSYEDLAEEALLANMHRSRKVEETFHQRSLAFATQALEMGLRVRPLPWGSFHSLLGQVEDPRDRAFLGSKLFAGLRKLSQSKGKEPPWQPTDPGLMEFFEFVRGEYGNGSDPERKGVWLSLVTILGKALGGKPEDWARSTLENLLKGKESVDLKTALDLLTFFPVDDAREAVLKWIEGEMGKDLPQASRWDLLGFALEVLGRMGAPEDRVLLKGIRELSLGLVRKKGFPMKLREAALDLGGKLDGPGVLEGFQPIVLSSSDQIPSSLRMRAFGWVETLGTSLLQAEKGPGAITEAERILAFFFQCLSDPEPRLREQVCKSLEAFPPSPKNFPEAKRREWGGRILGRVGKRLREETDAHVIEALRQVFLGSGKGSLLGATVLEHYVGVLLHWGEKRRAEYVKLLPAFLQDLRELLKQKGMPPKILVAYARSLNRAGLKRPAAEILDAPALVALDQGADALPENQRVEARRIRKERAALLLALLGEEGLPGTWTPAKQKTLAQRILGARRGLLTLGGENPMALFYLGWAELFEGNTQEAEKVLARFRAAHPAAGPGVLSQAGLLEAKALLKMGKAKAAAELLAKRKDLDALLLLLEARKAIGDHQGVVASVQELLQTPGFPSTGPKNVDVLMDQAQAQIAMKDLKGAEETLKSLPLLSRAAARTRLKLLRTELEELRKKLQPKEGNPSEKNAAKKGKTGTPVPSKKAEKPSKIPSSRNAPKSPKEAKQGKGEEKGKSRKGGGVEKKDSK